MSASFASINREKHVCVCVRVRCHNKRGSCWQSCIEQPAPTLLNLTTSAQPVVEDKRCPPPALRSRRFCTPEEARSHVRPQTHGHDLLSPCKVVAIMTPCSIGLTRTRCPMLFFLPPLFTTSPQARWKTGESAPPPPSGQELYRISLLNMAKLEEPFPSPQTQAQATNPLSRANAVHQPPQEPHDYSYLLGGAGAGLRQHQGFTEPHVPPPMIP